MSATATELPAAEGSAMPAEALIKEARQRARRRRVGVAAGAVLAAVALGLGITGGSNGRHADVTWASAGNGITVQVPPGWHLIRPPITSLSYPEDRLLLTSYATRPGGDCAPDAAAAALPAGGALIYLFEYTERDLPNSAFPRRRTTWPLGGRGSPTECWRISTHLLRFGAAGRAFQAHVAFGRDATVDRRAQVEQILDSMRVTAASTDVHP